MDMGEVMDRLMDVFTMTPEREKSEREVLDRLVASMRRPPADSLIGALEMLTSAIASPAQDYVANKGVSGKAVREGLTGKRKTDWVDVVQTRYPKLNQGAAKVYGSVLNMLLDPTNLIPGGAIAGKIKNVYHGSPHLFEKFDLGKVGTGEGAQSYGHGLYFAGKKSIGKYYQEALGSKAHTMELGNTKYSVDEKYAEASPEGRVVKHIFDSIDRGYTPEFALSSAKTVFKNSPAEMDVLKDVNTVKVYSENKGHLYKVDLAPDEDELLLWDKPLSEQSEKVKAALEQIKTDHPDAYKASDNLGWANELYHEMSYNFGSDKAASDYLHSLGVRGIKYLDGASRGKGEGSYNYVIFDDKDIKIKGRK